MSRFADSVRRQLLALTLGLAAALAPAQAADTDAMSRALDELERDIAQARQELHTQRNRVAEQRRQFADTMSGLEEELRELRDRRRRQQAALEDRETQLRRARANADHADELVAFTASALVEHRRNLGTRLPAPLRFVYRQQLRRVDALLDTDSERQQLAAGPPLLRLSRSHTAQTFGGSSYAEQALTPAGETQPGLYLDFGLFRYFVPEDPDRPAGLARQAPDASRPLVFADFGPGNAGQSVRALKKRGRATLPVDVSGGAATQLAAATPRWHEHLAQGGFVMIPLLLLALVCLVLAVYKILALRGLQLRDPEQKIRELLDCLATRGEEAALAMTEDLRPPLRAVIAEGIRHRNAPKEGLEEILYERLIAQTPRLERLLTPLAVCASTAPLLGLLGTVTGMIHTFRLITVYGSGDARVLSSGISEALVTTEVGLAIAIPALLLHAFLSRRVSRAVANSQRAAITFVNGLTVRPDPAGGEGGARQ